MSIFSFEAWVKVGDHYISMGKFLQPAFADTGKYYYAGTSVPAFLGEDFLINPTTGNRRINGVTKPLTVAYDVFVTVEPTTETGIGETSPTPNAFLYTKRVTVTQTQ